MTSFALISSIRSFGEIRRTTIVLLAVILVQLCTGSSRDCDAVHCLRWPNAQSHLFYFIRRTRAPDILIQDGLKNMPETQGKPQCSSWNININTHNINIYPSFNRERVSTCGYLVATVASDFKLGIVAEIRTSSEHLFHDIWVVQNSTDLRKVVQRICNININVIINWRFPGLPGL